MDNETRSGFSLPSPAKDQPSASRREDDDVSQRSDTEIRDTNSSKPELISTQPQNENNGDLKVKNVLISRKKDIISQV